MGLLKLEAKTITYLMVVVGAYLLELEGFLKNLKTM